jgi:hypothetical protein
MQHFVAQRRFNLYSMYTRVYTLHFRYSQIYRNYAYTLSPFPFSRQFNAQHFDAERWTDEQIAFKAALAANGVTDFDPSFYVTAGYGPYMDPNAHNEIWVEQV